MRPAFLVLALLIAGPLVMGTAFVSGRIFAMRGEGKTGAAQTDVAMLSTALTLFERDCGRKPTPAEGLGALDHAPGDCPRWRAYFDTRRPIDDPWGHAYVLSGTLGVRSAGADGAFGTPDDIGRHP